ncbi:glycosyltransferase 87 family protein [Streptomyces cirratus]
MALPFTYPPFAALVFLPLAYLPWWLTQVLWQLLSLTAALYLVRGSFALLHPDRRPSPPGSSCGRRPYCGWNPCCTGSRSVRSACRSPRCRWPPHSGRAPCRRYGDRPRGRGQADPAGGVLYLLAAGRRRAAGWAAATFAATVVLAALVAPVESWRYWGICSGTAGASVRSRRWRTSRCAAAWPGSSGRTAVSRACGGRRGCSSRPPRRRTRCGPPCGAVTGWPCCWPRSSSSCWRARSHGVTTGCGWFRRWSGCGTAPCAAGA